MEKMSGVELQEQGGLKKLVLRWFTETQAGLILDHGNFPDWFQGFAARKEAEDLLRDKPLGCFLIRLSDKAVGYILSYRGLDRCRHFVITQNPDGQFVISGDCQTHHSLMELIDHYRLSPIQPFGEHLTCSCYEVKRSELYDVVNHKTKMSGVSVQALRFLWDQKSPRNSATNRNQRTQPQHEPATAQPPDLPSKSQSCKLTGTVSADAMSLSQAEPPVPKRNVPLSFSLRDTFPDTVSHPSETQSVSFRSDRLRGNTTTDVFYTKTPAGNTELTQSESSNPPSPLKKVTCHTYSLHDPGAQRPSSSTLRPTPFHQAPEGPTESSAGQRDVLYAEVAERPKHTGLPEDTYEQIPGDAATNRQSNTYESLDDMKSKKHRFTWGKNHVKWKKFLPEYKKK
nr:PREDICTED: SH2 domain-containing protein 7-like [Paralichthys olivaceus]